jgi:putative ABC transport system ATP-binding protein
MNTAQGVYCYNMPMTLIELKNISKTYKTGSTKATVLNNVNVVINEGELVAIIGPSGSGKSTLMHILGLLDKPTSGQYTLNNQRMDQRKDRELAVLRRELIGFVFQSFNLLARLTVLQNVMLPLAYSGTRGRKRKEQAMKLLAQVGIDDHANYRTNQISGGQTQRVAIARALANSPQLILADEPTGNLDTASSETIIELLQKLHADGNTVVIVTHNPEIASRADRIIEIRDGQIVSDKARKKQ